MQRQASQPDFGPAPPEQPQLPAPQPAGAVTAATSAGSGSAAGAVLPAQPPTPVPAPVVNTLILPRPTRPTRSAGPALLIVLASGALTYNAQGSRFESIAAETLNNAGTSDDGFDDLITPVLADFGADQPALASLSAGLTDADFVGGAFTAAVHAPITADIADLLSSGDSALVDVATAFGVSPDGGVVPAVPVIVTPPDNSGGGGGGGREPDTAMGGEVGGPGWWAFWHDVM